MSFSYLKIFWKRFAHFVLRGLVNLVLCEPHRHRRPIHLHGTPGRHLQQPPPGLQLPRILGRLRHRRVPDPFIDERLLGSERIRNWSSCRSRRRSRRRRRGRGRHRSILQEVVVRNGGVLHEFSEPVRVFLGLFQSLLLRARRVPARRS